MRDLLGHLFYFIGLFIFSINLFIIRNLKDYIKIEKWIKAYNKINEREPLLSDLGEEKSKKFKDNVTYAIITGVWLFLGLLSNSWYVFMLILILDTLVRYLIKLLNLDYTLFGISVRYSLHITQTITILFLIINHFHLHIDIYNYVTDLLF